MEEILNNWLQEKPKDKFDKELHKYTYYDLMEFAEHYHALQLQQTGVKCRFFAQYWGTKTLYVGGVGLVEIGKGGWNLKHPDFFLQLKPLSKITDEDAISMYRGLERNYESANQFLEDYKSIGFLEQSEVDFLRSKGYAVPFMGYSVDDLVKIGWVQLV